MPALSQAASRGAGLPLPQQIERMDSARLRAYRENLDFYHGHQ